MTLLSPLVIRVRTVVEEQFRESDSAHDLGHLDRVARLAHEIATDEGIDPEAAAVAAYVHDYHRILESRWGRTVSPVESLPEVRQVLVEADAGPRMEDTVAAAVATTDIFTFAGDAVDTTNLLAACLRDADMLDAMGAIGIARAFLYGGRMNEPMWVPDHDLQEQYREGRTSSVVAHFYEKLLNLRGEIYTSAGRRKADERHLFMIEFLHRFHYEYGDRHEPPAPLTSTA